MGGRIPCGLRAAWHNVDLELRWRLRAQPEQLMKYLNFLKDKQRKQAARAGFLFTDVMTSDLLMHFLRGPAFFRVSPSFPKSCVALQRFSRSHTRTRRQTPGVFCMHRRITHTAQAACSTVCAQGRSPATSAARAHPPHPTPCMEADAQGERPASREATSGHLFPTRPCLAVSCGV
jgi:hypothetical protein